MRRTGTAAAFSTTVPCQVLIGIIARISLQAPPAHTPVPPLCRAAVGVYAQACCGSGATWPPIKRLSALIPSCRVRAATNGTPMAISRPISAAMPSISTCEDRCDEWLSSIQATGSRKARYAECAAAGASYGAAPYTQHQPLRCALRHLPTRPTLRTAPICSTSSATKPGPR